MEELLNEDEGSTLDFKRNQYPFDKATPEQKSELLKDILAFIEAKVRKLSLYCVVPFETQEAEVGVSQAKATQQRQAADAT